ncbi:zinc finger CCHC domain-containing protein 17 isoform X2 [Anabrus simplex]|uniref:zinc finger CCHC domain-containing protein 17 isoform X2 n=1 Tax=Anabrus simplex TaxID=316456 RepID=UPI0035A31886
MSSEDDKHRLLNTIFLGEVASVHNYGAFVKIPGGREQGLVHRTQVSKAVVEDVTEVLQRGERVWCKVISITDDDKIALSMKVVDQGNGVDLDPNGVQIHLDEQRRKNQPLGSQRRVIQLDAVFKTTCTKCGTAGHLSKDCFQSPDGKKYELLPEEEDDSKTAPHLQQELIISQEAKHKKEKKKKKKKKHKKEKEMKKKEKAKKKRRSRTSNSSSDSVMRTHYPFIDGLTTLRNTDFHF